MEELRALVRDNSHFVSSSSPFSRDSCACQLPRFWTRRVFVGCSAVSESLLTRLSDSSRR